MNLFWIIPLVMLELFIIIVVGVTLISVLTGNPEMLEEMFKIFKLTKKLSMTQKEWNSFMNKKRDELDSKMRK